MPEYQHEKTPQALATQHFHQKKASHRYDDSEHIYEYVYYLGGNENTFNSGKERDKDDFDDFVYERFYGSKDNSAQDSQDSYSSHDGNDIVGSCNDNCNPDIPSSIGSKLMFLVKKFLHH